MFGVSWRFHSSLISGASIQKSATHYRKKWQKKGGAPCEAPPCLSHTRLELQTQAELHPARRVCAVQIEKVRASVRRTDGVELRMVEEVEILPAEIQFFGFAELKSLK